MNNDPMKYVLDIRSLTVFGSLKDDPVIGGLCELFEMLASVGCEGFGSDHQKDSRTLPRCRKQRSCGSRNQCRRTVGSEPEVHFSQTEKDSAPKERESGYWYTCAADPPAVQDPLYVVLKAHHFLP